MEAIQRRGRNNLTGNITVNVRSNATGVSRAVTAKQDVVLHADSRVRYRWSSRYVIAAMLVDGKQKIAH